MALAVALALAVPAAGCDAAGGGRERASAAAVERACAAVGACQGDAGQRECESFFEVVVALQQCTDALETASCEEHAMAEPSYEDVCQPHCTSMLGFESLRCEGNDAISTCTEIESEQRRVTLRCEALCESQGRQFAGVCGREYTRPEGRAVHASHDTCFCVDATG